MLAAVLSRRIPGLLPVLHLCSYDVFRNTAIFFEYSGLFKTPIYFRIFGIRITRSVVAAILDAQRMGDL